MTRHAREAVSLACATALGEAVMQGFMTTDWSAVGAIALVFLFLLGPPLFLALVAWRRRTHPTRSRVLFGVAVAVALIGLGVLGFDLYRYSTDAKFRATANMHATIVPLIQWGIILAVWLWLVIREGQEKRATKNPPQSP